MADLSRGVQNVECRVSGTAVHDDDFVRRARLRGNRIEETRQRARLVFDGEDERNSHTPIISQNLVQNTNRWYTRSALNVSPRWRGVLRWLDQGRRFLLGMSGGYCVSWLLGLIYFVSAFALAIYGFNILLTAWLYWRKRDGLIETPPLTDLPRVTVQLPIYNELYVVERLIDAAAALDWQRERLQIQVLGRFG